NETLVECFCRVHTRVPQQVIHRDYLGHHGNVLARIQRHGDQGNIHSKYGSSLLVQAGALDDCICPPLLEPHDNLQSLLLPYCTNTENGRDVYQPHATNLHVMALQLHSLAYHHICTSSLEANQVVCHQPVPSLHKVQHALGLSDSARSREEQANTVHVGKASVQRGGGSKLLLE